MQHWHISNRADPRAASIADRHYNRQKIGAPQFVPPGRCLVLLTEHADAVWVTSWPIAEYVKHAWAGAWVNSLFRNESGILSSELIREAVAITRWYRAFPFWKDGDLKNAQWLGETEPTTGIVTFVDPTEVRSSNPGACYQKAGWKRVGHTAGGLLAWQQMPDRMPKAMAPMGNLQEVMEFV